MTLAQGFIPVLFNGFRTASFFFDRITQWTGFQNPGNPVRSPFFFYSSLFQTVYGVR